MVNISQTECLFKVYVTVGDIMAVIHNYQNQVNCRNEQCVVDVVAMTSLTVWSTAAWCLPEVPTRGGSLPQSLYTHVTCVS